MSHEVLCLQFQHLTKIRLPGCLNLRGFVGKVRSLGNTKNDNTPMAAFELLDAGGMHVECIAHGPHAESQWVREGVELAVYFATAQPGRDGREGAVWFY